MMYKLLFCKRGQSGILKHFKLPENVNPKKVDEEMKEKIKGEAHIGISVTFCTAN